MQFTRFCRATRVRALCEQIMAAGRLQHAFPRAMRPLVPRLEKVRAFFCGCITIV